MSGDVTPIFKAPKPAARRRAWNSTLPAARSKKPRATKVTLDMRQMVYARAGGRCQADGLHHPDCPSTLTGGDWSAHHVQPRNKGGADELGNLIAVWCPGGLGWNGCHGRIHGRPTQAKQLGLLAGGVIRAV